MLTQAMDTMRSVDALVVDSERCHGEVHNAFNTYRQLANTQFFEQRVMEDDHLPVRAAEASRAGAEESPGSSIIPAAATSDAPALRAAPGWSDGASPPGKTFEEHVGARYREAIALASLATKGRWVPAAPHPASSKQTEPAAPKDGNEGGGPGPDGKEAGGEEDDSSSPTSAAPPKLKLIGNRFWRPLPHVIGTQEFYQDDTLGIDPARAIAPDAATAAAVGGGAPVGGPYHWDDDGDGRSDTSSDLSDTSSSDVSSDTSTDVSDDTSEEEEEDELRESGWGRGDVDGEGAEVRSEDEGSKDFRAMLDARLKDPEAAGSSEDDNDSESDSEEKTREDTEEEEEDDIFGSGAPKLPKLHPQRKGKGKLHGKESGKKKSSGKSGGKIKRQDASGSEFGESDEDLFGGSGGFGAGGPSVGGYRPRAYNLSFQDVFGGDKSESLFGVDEAASAAASANETIQRGGEAGGEGVSDGTSPSTSATRRPSASAATVASLFGSKDDDEDSSLFPEKPTSRPTRPPGPSMPSPTPAAFPEPPERPGVASGLFDSSSDEDSDAGGGIGRLFGAGAGVKSGSADLFAGPLIADPLANARPAVGVAGATVSGGMADAAATGEVVTSAATARLGSLFAEPDVGTSPAPLAPPFGVGGSGGLGGLFDDDTDDEDGGGLFSSPDKKPFTKPSVGSASQSKSGSGGGGGSLFGDDAEGGSLFATIPLAQTHTRAPAPVRPAPVDASALAAPGFVPRPLPPPLEVRPILSSDDSSSDSGSSDGGSSDGDEETKPTSSLTPRMAREPAMPPSLAGLPPRFGPAQMPPDDSRAVEGVAALAGRLAINPAAMIPGARPVIPRAKAPRPPRTEAGTEGTASSVRHAGFALPGMERVDVSAPPPSIESSPGAPDPTSNHSIEPPTSTAALPRLGTATRATRKGRRLPSRKASSAPVPDLSAVAAPVLPVVTAVETPVMAMPAPPAPAPTLSASVPAGPGLFGSDDGDDTHHHFNTHAPGSSLPRGGASPETKQVLVASTTAVPKTSARETKSIFDNEDDDDDGFFSSWPASSAAPATAPPSEAVKGAKLSSLFDDDEDDGGGLFG